MMLTIKSLGFGKEINNAAITKERIELI